MLLHTILSPIMSRRRTGIRLYRGLLILGLFAGMTTTVSALPLIPLIAGLLGSPVLLYTLVGGKKKALGIEQSLDKIVANMEISLTILQWFVLIGCFLAVLFLCSLVTTYFRRRREWYMASLLCRLRAELVLIKTAQSEHERSELYSLRDKTVILLSGCVQRYVRSGSYAARVKLLLEHIRDQRLSLDDQIACVDHWITIMYAI